MLNSIITAPMTAGSFFVCIAAALALGILTALVFGRGSFHTGSYSVTLALLPAVVAMVIMLVNGNVGAGVAVAGTFALVRFRSMPGTAREITGLFFAVSLGLACGMGYVAMAAVFFVIISCALFVLDTLKFGIVRSHRHLKITIPEDLDYEDLFDDLLDEYALSHELIKVQTTNMGTLYELSYDVCLKDDKISKKFIDSIRCRNGNLPVIIGRHSDKEMM